MSWTYRDSRGDENAPSEEELRDAENERQAKRFAIRQEIAALELKKQRADLLGQEIARIDAEAEQAADDHQAATGPLQDELQRLEQAAISRIASRLPADKDSDDRRAAIISEIQQHNEALELVVERCKRLRGPIEYQRQKLLVEAAPLGALRNKLTNIGYADPALLLESHCSLQRGKFASARVAAA